MFDRYVRALALIVPMVGSLARPCLAKDLRHSPSPQALYYAAGYSTLYGVPRELVFAIITEESGWNPGAVSIKGAMGLMQLMPGTASRFAVSDPFSIEDNIRGGVAYLALLMNQFHDLRLVVAAYYCGEHALGRQGLAYSNPDVVRYVNDVRSLYERELSKTQDHSFSETGDSQ